MKFFTTTKTIDIRVGDIVRGYKKGYWRVLKITPRFITKDLLKYYSYKGMSLGDEISCLISVIRYCDDDFNVYKSPKKVDEWDGGWCKKITSGLLMKEKQDVIDNFDKGIDLLDTYYARKGN